MGHTEAPDRPHVAVVLKHPIKFGSETISTVYVKRPRAGDMALAPVHQGGVKYFAGDAHPFAARLCGLSPAEFDLLDIDDYAAVMQAVQGFQTDFPQTGSSAAPGSPAV